MTGKREDLDNKDAVDESPSPFFNGKEGLEEAAAFVRGEDTGAVVHTVALRTPLEALRAQERAAGGISTTVAPEPPDAQALHDAWERGYRDGAYNRVLLEKTTELTHEMLAEKISKLMVMVERFRTVLLDAREMDVMFGLETSEQAKVTAILISRSKVDQLLEQINAALAGTS
jgi:hypothetical protein